MLGVSRRRPHTIAILIAQSGDSDECATATQVEPIFTLRAESLSSTRVSCEMKPWL